MADNLLRVPEVLARTGFCRATLYNKIKAGEFVTPVELGSNSIAFIDREVDEWIAARPRRTYGIEAWG
jgi:prophage regulatory protein